MSVFELRQLLDNLEYHCGSDAVVKIERIENGESYPDNIAELRVGNDHIILVGEQYEKEV